MTYMWVFSGCIKDIELQLKWIGKAWSGKMQLKSGENARSTEMYVLKSC